MSADIERFLTCGRPLEGTLVLEDGPNAGGVEMEVVLLKIPEVIDRLAVGQSTVYELLSSGALRSVKVGRARRVRSDDLEQFIAELDDSPPNVRIPSARRSTARAS